MPAACLLPRIPHLGTPAQAESGSGELKLAGVRNKEVLARTCTRRLQAHCPKGRLYPEVEPALPHALPVAEAVPLQKLDHGTRGYAVVVLRDERLAPAPTCARPRGTLRTHTGTNGPPLPSRVCTRGARSAQTRHRADRPARHRGGARGSRAVPAHGWGRLRASARLRRRAGVEALPVFPKPRGGGGPCACERCAPPPHPADIRPHASPSRQKLDS
jgi:hypothetical protein